MKALAVKAPVRVVEDIVDGRNGVYTDPLLSELRRRIGRLEADLKRLRTAEDVVRSLQTIDDPPLCSKPKRLVEAVAIALREIGPARPAEIIEWLQEHWGSDVNPGSVRSTLSGHRDKLFRNDGGKWRGEWS